MQRAHRSRETGERERAIIFFTNHEDAWVKRRSLFLMKMKPNPLESIMVLWRRFNRIAWWNKKSAKLCRKYF